MSERCEHPAKARVVVAEHEVGGLRHLSTGHRLISGTKVSEVEWCSHCGALWSSKDGWRLAGRPKTYAELTGIKP